MVAKTLDAFISTIKTEGAARLNRFKVLVFNPVSKQSQYDELVCLYCEQAALPSITYASQPTRTFGDQREVVYERTFETLNLTFLIDRQFKVKEYFDVWGDLIINPRTRLCGFYDDYARNIQIIAQDLKDNDIYTTWVYEAYPKSIAAINLDNNSKEVAKLQVTFNYKYHVNSTHPSPSENAFGEPTKVFARGQGKLDLQYELLSNVLDVPDTYLNNFDEFQRAINDSLAISNIERQGQIVGTGIASLYNRDI